MPTSTVEDYLKQLYMQQQSAVDALVTTGKLAEAMGVAPGTATAMIKTLAESGLVEYEPRGGARLSAAGEKLALHVLRRHRLVELFLVNVLGLDWSEVHAEAEQLEHATSEKVLDRMDQLLGQPSVDPHGDPIPTSKGKLARPVLHSLADCPLEVAQLVARVMDQNAGFLQFVDRQGLTPGTAVFVESRNPQADVVKLRVRERSSVIVGMSAACKIQVEPES